MQNESCNGTAGCEINCRAGAHRTPEDDDPVRLDTHGLRQIVIRRFLIIVGVRLGGLAPACSVSLVVIRKDGEAGAPDVLQ